VLGSRTLLLDTDFFVLMAGANLIAPLLEALELEHGSVRRLAVDAHGFGAVSKALTAVRDYNRTIRLLLPEASATPEEHFRAGVASYLEDLKTNAGFLLFQPG